MKSEWEVSCAKAMPHLWLSDCEALVSHLKNPKDERLENVRLSIDIASLKQRLWTDKEGEMHDDVPVSRCKDNKTNNMIRWIDTSAMCLDSLTKKMKADSLYPVMDGHIDLTPSAESILIKLRKQKQRQSKSAEKTAQRERDEAAVNEREAKPYASFISTCSTLQRNVPVGHIRKSRLVNAALV